MISQAILLIRFRGSADSNHTEAAQDRPGEEGERVGRESDAEGPCQADRAPWVVGK
jgi:hypothetical protein